jgi:type II secretion system protein I
MRRGRGFTLIEVVVAIAVVALVVATAAMAAGQALKRVDRMERQLLTQRALLSLKDAIELEPLFDHTSGAGEWSGVSYRWRAERLRAGSEWQPPAEAMGGRANGRFEIALFEIELHLAHEDSTLGDALAAEGGGRMYHWRTLAYRLREGG